MSIRKVGNFNFEKSLRRFRGKKRDLPRKIGNDALNFFKQSFLRGGFTDRGFKKWVPRWKRLSRTRTSRSIKEPATLIGPGSGKLFRAMAVLLATFPKIVVGTRGIDYARRHNEGLTDSLGRRMPKRKFIGRSRKLERDIEKQILREIDKVFNV